MGLGHEKLHVYRPSVMLADSVEKATACRRVPQPAPTEPVAVDSDFDFDPRDEKTQQTAARNALTHVRAPRRCELFID